uniref:Phage or prophage related protein n=1 Tax=Streptomyces sp. NBC_00093 TaxID=2975649 RepID=A0AAU1ZSR0_9ACTN
MARIRTIKPEAFVSESLAAVTLTAERTFLGLLTQADDQGRHRDHAAIIAGQLWVLRPEHTPSDVETDLAQLSDAGLICRYTGPDDKRYLHIVTWHQHQKINRPSVSRLPSCPHHDARAGAAPSVTRVGFTESSPLPPGALREGTPEMREPAPNPGTDDEAPGQEGFTQSSVRAHGGLPESSVKPHCPDLGPRIMDLGSTPSGGASAPAPDTVSAQQLITEYVAACNHRPPGDFLGHLGRQVRKLLDEGVAPAHLRAALERHRAKGMHPSSLPSLVNEVMNATPNAPAVHRPWTNPTDVAAAYGDEL